MTNQTNAGFEIPEEMKALAEKSVEQARQAFDSFVAATRHAISTTETQAASAQAGVKEVGALTLRFAERNVAASFEHAQNLMRANDLQEMLTLHADYTKRQIATLGEQAKELSEKAIKLTGQSDH